MGKFPPRTKHFLDFSYCYYPPEVSIRQYTVYRLHIFGVYSRQSLISRGAKKPAGMGSDCSDPGASAHTIAAAIVHLVAIGAGAVGLVGYEGYQFAKHLGGWAQDAETISNPDNYSLMPWLKLTLTFKL